jgi:nicotinamide mononucleotide adenylyltransferase
MGTYCYVDPKKVLPSQDFLKDGTVRMITNALATGQLDRVPPPPIIRAVGFSTCPVAIDGHNLLAVKLLMGENCLVYLAEHSNDHLPLSANEPAVSQRNRDLTEKFAASEDEARQLFAQGITGMPGLLTRYPDLADYVRQTLHSKWLNVQGLNSEYVTSAFVHGRFQPFHLQHLEYIVAAKQRCQFLYIGITRSDPTQQQQCEVAPHRADSSANLLSYFERTEMISRCLLAEGVSREHFGFVPIPIDNPKHLPYFMGTDIQCFTTTCDDWNLHKISVLERHGYKVLSLIDRRRRSEGVSSYVSGSMIRNLIAQNDDSWVALVPKAVAAYLMQIGYPARLMSQVKLTSDENLSHP